MRILFLTGEERAGFLPIRRVPNGGGSTFQGVMTHEIGHFLGLGHTPLQGSLSVRPTMYPFFFGGERSLEPDNRAGVSALYPSPAALNNGAISGQVTHPDGRGAFGVHVVAYTTDTETFVVSALSGAAGDGGGRYKISGAAARGITRWPSSL